MLRFTLPNGVEISALTRRSAIDLYADIFTDRMYGRHIEISPHDVIFDAGANIGMFPLWLDSLGMPLRVFCFEPMSETSECLRVNTESLRHVAASCYTIGLGAEPAWGNFLFYPRAPECSTLHPELMEALAPAARRWIKRQECTLAAPLRWLACCLTDGMREWIAERIRRHHLKPVATMVPLITVSQALYSCGQGRLDLLKIDTEGSEEAIMRGIAQDDWKRIRQLVIECHAADMANRLSAMLHARGYKITMDANPQLPELPMIYASRRTS